MGKALMVVIATMVLLAGCATTRVSVNPFATPQEGWKIYTTVDGFKMLLKPYSRLPFFFKVFPKKRQIYLFFYEGKRSNIKALAIVRVKTGEPVFLSTFHTIKGVKWLYVRYYNPKYKVLRLRKTIVGGRSV